MLIQAHRFLNLFLQSTIPPPPSLHTIVDPPVAAFFINPNIGIEIH
jgi:hypothetical protein